MGEYKANVQETTINKYIIDGLMETIRNLYLADDIPWVIGYSGGKDSSATLQLVWLALKGLPKEKIFKPVHIINTDTLVESPVVSRWATESLRKMDEAAKKQGLPFFTHKLTPNHDNTFWVNLIGRGYPFPRKRFRWCTDRMKIKPVNDFIMNCIAAHGEIILVLGTRKAESANRAKTMAHYEKLRVRELLSPNPTLANELVFSPLENWTDNDVWLFLMQYENPWGYSNTDLLTLYRGATADGECPMMVEEGLPSCGRSRFGCWVCTMVEQDKSMEAMIANDSEKEWMTPLLEFRNEIGEEELDRDRRDFRKRGGFLQGYKGDLVHGPYKKEIRERWLMKLLEVQEEVRRLCPDEFKDLSLITLQELQAIRDIWLNEFHEFDDAVPRIYERVLKKKYPIESIYTYQLYGENEWNILKKVCEPSMNNGEELLFQMMYSLVDIERKSNVLNSRKGIIGKLEKVVRQNFYKNEEDAKSYYFKRLNRKKDLGGKFNENAIEIDPLENEEISEETQ